MADKITIPRPVQVILDAKRFIDVRQPRLFQGGNRDFYVGNDRGFSAHRSRVRSRLTSVSSAMRTREQSAGFIHVQLREEAFAKTYRPLGSLFTARNGFSLVGAGRVGEMIFQTTAPALEKLDKLIEARAEDTPRLVQNEKTGKIEPRVSGYRSEVGAVADINLHDKADRVDFSAEEAVAWFQQPDVIGGYLVELFPTDPHSAPNEVRQSIEQFRQALSGLPSGVHIQPFLSHREESSLGDPKLAISVELLRNEQDRNIMLPYTATGEPLKSAETDRSSLERVRDLRIASHQALLNVLSEQTLVRSIELPLVIESAPAANAIDLERPSIPVPDKNGSYPVVGIIDGGVAALPELTPWKVADSGIVPSGDRDESHGTFIAGLVVAGNALNPHLAGSLESSGCKFYDLDLFPKKELRSMYYPDIDYFFDMLDEKIKVAKSEHGVRVFNFSFGLKSHGRFGYSIFASRIDRMARANDVILVVAAGNLQQGQTRAPWTTDPQAVLSMLAGYGGQQRISAPAEHLFGFTVGAINPPGIPGHGAGLPTTYTRRGPGIGGARKPDLAHYGGVESGLGTGNRTGLASIGVNGDVHENCGTSFATPNVSTTLATLDHRLGNSQPRELLMALPVHRAFRAPALTHSALRHISREFVGFGQPPACDALLSDDLYSITLVFSEILHRRQKLEFPFSWPTELVGKDNSCRGRVSLTLAYSPPLDPSHDEEAQRVQLEAHLHQEQIDPETKEVSWESQLKQDGSGVPQGVGKTERYLLNSGLKWTPIKRYDANMPHGRGNSSNWRLSLESQTRAGVDYPKEGVQFALIMTLADPKNDAPIHDAVRNNLVAQGLSLADILVAHRIRPQN